MIQSEQELKPHKRRVNSSSSTSPQVKGEAKKMREGRKEETEIRKRRIKKKEIKKKEIKKTEYLDVISHVIIREGDFLADLEGRESSVGASATSECISQATTSTIRSNTRVL